MQSYPQPPAQNITPQKPWWLIYGLSFGVSIILCDLIVSYVNSSTLLMKSIYGDLVAGFFVTCFSLLYGSACLTVGILVARKTRRARSAPLACLLIGLLLILSDTIIQIGGTGSLSSWYFLIQDFLLACLGCYLGFLGGLIGRITERTRKTIGLFYAIGVIFVGTMAPLLIDGLLFHTASSILDLSFIALGSLCGMVAWIMTLVQFAQAQSWGAFTLTFFFGGIMTLVYLIVGVPPRQLTPYAVPSPGAYVPVAVAYPPMQPAPAQSPQSDAVSLLQQRLARGEIDIETYRQILATLTSPPHA